MAEAYNTHEIIYQNLIDAGCDRAIADKCMLLVKCGKTSDVFSILTEHRKKLLDSVHTGQNKIDCLDVLIYRLRKLEMRKDLGGLDYE